MGNDYAGPQARQPQLGQAETDNDVLIPNSGDLWENNIRKWPPIGRIDNQRDVVCVSEFTQMRNLGISQHIAGWIGWAGYHNCSDI